MASSPPEMDHDRLTAWLGRKGFPPSRIEPLAGDVSVRTYLRIESRGRSLVVALYPPAIRSVCGRFRATTALLRRAGVRVPEILAGDCRRGWMVLEDLGHETLYDRRDRPWEELRGPLAGAAAIADRIAALPVAAVAELNPPLDRSLLERELEQTFEVFLGPRGLAGDPAEAEELRAALTELCRRLAAPPMVACHRDLMARNLMPLADGGVAVLDHQDLRLGPRFYDLASLLNDSLFPPPELVTELAGAAAAEPAYRRAAAQRGLKAVGTFAAFAARGQRRHLRLIPPTLERALGHLERLPESAAIARRLAARWRAFC